MKPFRLGSMHRLLFNSRTLMTMMLVGGMFMLNDAFGQCDDCNNGAGCTTNASATGDCSFAAGDGALATGVGAVAVSDGDAAGDYSFAGAGGGAEGDYSTGLSNGNGLDEYAVGIGDRSIADAVGAIAIGTGTRADGAAAISIGLFNYADAASSVALGAWTKTNSANTFNYVFGKGLSIANALENDISNSIMMGMNSDVSTVFIGNSGGSTGTYGNVGIGNITSPSSLLHVRDQMRVGNASSDNGSIVFNNATNSNTVTFQTGVTSSTHTYTLPLDQGSADQVLTNNGSGVLSWEDAADANAWRIDGNGNTDDATNFLGTTNAEDLVIKTNDTEKMRVESGGNVGIGTSTPDGLLHLYAGASASTLLVLEAASALTRMIQFQEAGANTGYLRQFGSNDLIELRNETSGADLRFNVRVGTTQTNALSIYGSNGYVGIGKDFNTPTFRLDVRAEDIEDEAEDGMESVVCTVDTGQFGHHRLCSSGADRKISRCRQYRYHTGHGVQYPKRELYAARKQTALQLEIECHPHADGWRW